MKIAVLAIAKDEGKHVVRWAESAAEADQIILVDTGSTDGTYEIALDHPRIKAHRAILSSWRFDLARNIALSLVPADVDWVVNLDLDEVLKPGWRQAMDAAVIQNPGANRFQYPYVWNWQANGQPGVTFNRDMIHTRHGWLWKNPVHEVLTPVGQKDRPALVPDLHVEHHADRSKSRSQYLNLLRISVTETPNDARCSFYLARELFLYKNYDESIIEFEKYLNLPTANWPAERSEAMKILSEIYQRKGDIHESFKMARLAVAEDPNRRETWLRLAQLCNNTARWAECFAASESALGIIKKTGSFLDTAEAWGSWPHHLMGMSLFRLGMVEKSLTILEAALKEDPDNEKLLRDYNTVRSRIP